MITVTSINSRQNDTYGSGNNKVVANLVGLSTDEKPTGYANGSALLEMDTSKVYVYDEAGSEWIEVNKSEE